MEYDADKVDEMILALLYHATGIPQHHAASGTK
ncbi:MAG: hypothetical protein BWY25_00470 [Chloroflexi bacterium ADurb.Bin222]|nr:MAG: hypothetical protein BWY25_00470 [Chloroflexi bacterium ADurb.Bin222]